MHARFCLTLLFAGLSCCSRTGPSVHGSGERRVDPTPGPDQPDAAVVVSAPAAIRPNQSQLAPLQRVWMDAAAAGHPLRVTIDARTTLGYGCDCAHFVFYDNSGKDDGPDMFFYPRVAPGVLPIAEWKVFGTFRLTGHFTGRRLGWAAWHEATFGRPEDPSEDQDLDPHPEFLVESWCYDDNDLALNQFNQERLAEMRRARLPQCRKPMAVAPLPPAP